MSNLEILEENMSSKSTTDMIIEKIIPIIWGLLLVSGLWYLLYTNVWVILSEEIRILLWFIASFGIIFLWIKLWEKLKYFWETIIWVWVLLLYGTLVYGSRSEALWDATIPEFTALIVSFIFTFIISFFAQKRQSKVIIVMSLLWSYLLPFVIWQNGSWTQSISFNSYLIYFTAINIVLFQMSKDFALKNIAPINILWLFFGTSSLYALSYRTVEISGWNFWQSPTLSAILFFLLSIFCIWSLLLTHKSEENKASWYLAIWYLGSILWFIINMNILSWVSEMLKWWLYILLSLSCFVWWHSLWEQKNRYEHIALYTWWVLLWILAFSTFVPEITHFISILIAYVWVIFGWLYFTDTSKKERLYTYYLFSFIWLLYAISFYDGVNLRDNIILIIASIPTLMAYFITKNENNENHEIAKAYGFFWLLVISFSILSYFVKYVNFEFLLFYIIPLIVLLFIKYNNYDIQTKTNILRVTLVWFVIWYFQTFFSMIWHLNPAPLNVYIFTHGWFFENWLLINWFFASIIWYISLQLSHKLDEEDSEYHPTFLVVIWFYITILLFWSHIIFAVLNDMWVPWERWWLRALWATFYWIILSIILIVIGVKKWIDYDIEKKLWLFLVFITLIKIVFYDLANMSMNNKIIVLMIVGWLLLMLSYFIHKNWWLKSQNMVSKKPKKELYTQTVERNVNNWNTSQTNEEPVSDIINQKIKDIDVSNIESITLKFLNNKEIHIKSKNLFKIAILVINKKQKNDFKPQELLEIYEYVIKNYKTELSKQDYNKLTSVIKEFAQIWGSFELKYKNV